jgi:hypothetical protein
VNVHGQRTRQRHAASPQRPSRVSLRPSACLRRPSSSGKLDIPIHRMEML